MSPIFVRPVREQLEHDRLIRFLQVKYKRKLDAAVNVGDARDVPVKIGAGTFFPDLVLTAGKKLAGVVEVETGESVNNLEAMAQWRHFSKARVPFHLYVPVSGYDAARRLCEANDAHPAEIWTYRPTNDGFDLVRIFQDASAAKQAANGDGNGAPARPAAKSGTKPTKAASKAKPESKPKPEPRPKPEPKPKGEGKRPAAKNKSASKPARRK